MKAIFALLLALTAGSSAAADEYTCLLPGNTRPPATATASKERAAAFAGYGSAAALFGKKVLGAWSERFLAERFKQEAPVVREQLAWSREKGVLLEVRIQKHKNPQHADYRKFLGSGLINLGSGTCPDEVLARVIHRGADVTAGAEEGYSYSPAESYYVWATRDRAGKVQFSTVAPGSSGWLIAEATGAAGLMWVRESQVQRAADALVDAMAREASARVATRQEKLAIEQLRLARLQAAQDYGKSMQELAKALERANEAEEALRALRIAKGVLSVAQTVQNVSAILSEQTPEVSQAMADAAARDDPAVLESVLKDYSGTLENQVKKRQDIQANARAAAAATKEKVKDKARAAGAPPQVTHDERLNTGWLP